MKRGSAAHSASRDSVIDAVSSAVAGGAYDSVGRAVTGDDFTSFSSNTLCTVTAVLAAAPGYTSFPSGSSIQGLGDDMCRLALLCMLCSRLIHSMSLGWRVQAEWSGLLSLGTLPDW